MEAGVAVAIGVAIAAIGTGVTVMTAIKQGEVAEAASKDDANIRLQEAESARLAAIYDEKQFRRRAQLLMAKNYAISSASGIDPDSGSPLLQQIDDITQTELEAVNIRRKGALTASAREFEAGLATRRGSYLRSSGYYNAAGAGLKGSASILGSFMKPYSRGYSGLSTNLSDDL